MSDMSDTAVIGKKTCLMLSVRFGRKYDWSVQKGEIIGMIGKLFRSHTHGHLHHHLITFLPLSANGHIALSLYDRMVFPIDGDDEISLIYPFRITDLQCKFLLSVWIDGDPCLSFSGEFVLLYDLCLLLFPL